MILAPFRLKLASIGQEQACWLELVALLLVACLKVSITGSSLAAGSAKGSTKDF